MSTIQANAIVVPRDELDLDRVLMSGQAFRWRRDDEGWWVSPVGSRDAVLSVARQGEELLVDALNVDPKAAASDYFRLDTSLIKLKEYWLEIGETELAESIARSPGLRIIRQEPVECLISFLCSSAAPIHRIRRSVDGMCRENGKYIGHWHGLEHYAFPELERLSELKRADLDLLGLGFRGRYVIEASREILRRGGRVWLDQLRHASYEEAKENLVTLPGVGEKVADCVCLFSLDKSEAVPIDVHMARVAKRQFAQCHEMKTVTAKSYALAANSFRQRYGGYAGWAQQYFFYAEIERRGLWDQDLGKHRPRNRGTVDG